MKIDHLIINYITTFQAIKQNVSIGTIHTILEDQITFTFVSISVLLYLCAPSTFLTSKIVLCCAQVKVWGSKKSSSHRKTLKIAD